MGDERWVAVAGFEGLYEVSDHGNVRSLARHVKTNNNKMLFCKGQSLNPWTVYGYEKVGLNSDGNSRQVHVHRLVAESFVSPERECQTHVNHIDGNKTNNHYSNLEWCTVSENNSHAIDTGLNYQKGSANSQSKLNEMQVRIIRRLCEVEYGNAREIGSLFGVTKSLVSHINRRKIWNHI